MSERATQFGRRVTATEAQLREMVEAALELEQTHGIPADQLITLIGFETAGSYHPWQRGPTTRHGQHRGFIQWGEPQRRQYGVHEGMPVGDQVLAAGRYLLDRGYKPGEHGVENMYAAILAGHADLIHRGDLHAGGVAPSAAVAAREMMDDEWATTRQLMNSFGSTPQERAITRGIPNPEPRPDNIGSTTVPRQAPPNPVPRPSDLPPTRPRGQSHDRKSQSAVSSKDRASTTAHSVPRTSSRAAMIEQHRLRTLEAETRRVRPTTHNPKRRSRPQRRLRPAT